MSARRLWTVEEANEALPRVTEVVERARRAVQAVRERAGEVRETAGGNGHPKSPPAAAGFQAAIEELAADGIVLRDPDRGLIDFPAAAPSGREYWLCWIVGERAVEWWHWPEAGFAGRTPLAQPPE